MTAEWKMQKVREAEIRGDQDQRSAPGIGEDVVIRLTANAEVDDVIRLKSSRLEVGS
jgi:hypothetical protein